MLPNGISAGIDLTNNIYELGGIYRWLDYDYESGSGVDHFAYDLTYQGPAVALSFNW